MSGKRLAWLFGVAALVVFGAHPCPAQDYVPRDTTAIYVGLDTGVIMGDFLGDESFAASGDVAFMIDFQIIPGLDFWLEFQGGWVGDLDDGGLSEEALWTRAGLAGTLGSRWAMAGGYHRVEDGEGKPQHGAWTSPIYHLKRSLALRLLAEMTWTQAEEWDVGIRPGIYLVTDFR